MLDTYVSFNMSKYYSYYQLQFQMVCSIDVPVFLDSEDHEAVPVVPVPAIMESSSGETETKGTLTVEICRCVNQTVKDNRVDSTIVLHTADVERAVANDSGSSVSADTASQSTKAVYGKGIEHHTTSTTTPVYSNIGGGGGFNPDLLKKYTRKPT